MNRQYLHKGKGINWLGYQGLLAYTSNPVKGCEHLCTWIMPDDSVAICYAKVMAKRMMNNPKSQAYKQGFEHITFHPKELKAIRAKKESANIFIDSMSDLLGTNVEDEHVMAVIETMRECPQHNFFLLTKNPSGLLKYGDLMPPNVWVGVSSPPSSMFGNAMNDNQTERWWVSALTAVTKHRHISWVSLEPLSWTIEQAHTMVEILDKYAHKLTWAVIGAASNGNKKYQPDKQVFQMVVDCLRKNNVPIHLKNNIDPALADEVCGAYLAEYPTPLAILEATTSEYGRLIDPDSPLLPYGMMRYGHEKFIRYVKPSGEPADKTYPDFIVPLGTPPINIDIPDDFLTRMYIESMRLPSSLLEDGFPDDLPQSGVIDWERLTPDTLNPMPAGTQKMISGYNWEKINPDDMTEDDKSDTAQTIRDYFEELRNRPTVDGGKMRVDYFEPHKGKRGDIIDAPKLDDEDSDDE